MLNTILNAGLNAVFNAHSGGRDLLSPRPQQKRRVSWSPQAESKLDAAVSLANARRTTASLCSTAPTVSLPQSPPILEWERLGAEMLYSD